MTRLPDPLRDPPRIRTDFDRIALALAQEEAGDEMQPCERALLGLLPARCGEVLEVGCGHGVLTRRLAARAERIVAIDLSPEMLRLASRRSADHPTIRYVLADAAVLPFGEAAFDVVLSVATLHHLPLASTIRRLAEALRPGGWLVVQDLVDRGSLAYLPLNALAWAARHVRARRAAPRVAGLYREHGVGERYLTPREARQAYAELLPGCRVMHDLEWRYTVCWRKAEATGPVNS